jgi:hypothetical protein
MDAVEMIVGLMIESIGGCMVGEGWCVGVEDKVVMLDLVYAVCVPALPPCRKSVEDV